MIDSCARFSELNRYQAFKPSFSNPIKWLDKQVEKLPRRLALAGGIVGVVVTVAAMFFSPAGYIAGSFIVTAGSFAGYVGLKQAKQLETKTSLNTRHKELNEEEKKLNEEESELLSKQKEQIDQLQKENTTLEESVKTLEKSANKVEEYKKNLEKLKERDKITTALYTQIKKEADALKTKFDKVKEKEEKAQRATVKLQGQLEELKTYIANIEEARKTFRKDKNGFKQALKENKALFDAAIAKSEKQLTKVSASKEEIKELGTMLSENRDKIQDQANRADALAEQLALHDKNVEGNLKEREKQHEQFMKDSKAFLVELQKTTTTFSKTDEDKKKAEDLIRQLEEELA